MNLYGRDLEPGRREKTAIREHSDFLNQLDECLDGTAPITSERQLWERMDQCLPPGEDILIIPRRPRQQRLTTLATGKPPRFLLVLCGSGNFAERTIGALKTLHNNKKGTLTSNFVTVMFLAISWSGKNESQLIDVRNVLCKDYGVTYVCVKTPAIKGAPTRCQ